MTAASIVQDHLPACIISLGSLNAQLSRWRTSVILFPVDERTTTKGSKAFDNRRTRPLLVSVWAWRVPYVHEA